MTQPLTDPCPVCRRMDGGHDQVVHDTVENGVQTWPLPGDSPTGEQD